MEIFETFNPIFLIFASYGLGVLGTGILKFVGIYDWFEGHNYICDTTTRNLGVLKLGWVIRKSFLGKFNQKLKFKGGLNEEKLIQLKSNMTFAENNHLIGFILLQVLLVFLAYYRIELWQIISYSLLNIIFNLYLVFLQQFNKRRIDRILKMRFA